MVWVSLRSDDAQSHILDIHGPRTFTSLARETADRWLEHLRTTRAHWASIDVDDPSSTDVVLVAMVMNYLFMLNALCRNFGKKSAPLHLEQGHTALLVYF